MPFKGGAEVLQAFVGGHINAVIDGGWAQIEKQGKGRVLLAFTEKRMARLPNVPTAIELGIDHVARSPIGLVGPKGMDPKVTERLNSAIRQVLDSPAIRQRFTEAGNTPRLETPEQFRATVRRDRAKWAEVVRASGATID